MSDTVFELQEVSYAYQGLAALNALTLKIRRGQRIALLGVEDLIVVAAQDALLIATKAHAESIKKIVDGLPKELR